MAVVNQYQPPASVIDDAARIGGLGNYARYRESADQRQQQIDNTAAFQRAQLADRERGRMFEAFMRNEQYGFQEDQAEAQRDFAEDQSFGWSEIETKFIVQAMQAETSERFLSPQENDLFNREVGLRDETPLRAQANAVILRWILENTTEKERETRALNDFIQGLLQSVKPWEKK